ncbi:MAG: hypothetical protein Q4C96_01730 [Planctomycetia bacterium]|nr:hypothetical protein [Planctomycetia bacterium]
MKPYSATTAIRGTIRKPSFTFLSTTLDIIAPHFCANFYPTRKFVCIFYQLTRRT